MEMNVAKRKTKTTAKKKKKPTAKDELHDWMAKIADLIEEHTGLQCDYGEGHVGVGIEDHRGLVLVGEFFKT